MPIDAIYTRSALAGRCFDDGLQLLKMHLSIDIEDTSKDVLLLFYLKAAHRAADSLVQQLFLIEVSDEEGEITYEEIPIPESIEQWILMRVNRIWENRAEGLVSVALANLGNVSWHPSDFTLLQDYMRRRV